MRQSAQRNKITPAQLKKLHACWRQMAPALADDRDARITFAVAVIGREIESFRELSIDEAGLIIEEMEQEIRRASTTHHNSPQTRAASVSPTEAARVIPLRSPNSLRQAIEKVSGTAADAPTTHTLSSLANPPSEHPNTPASAAARIFRGATEQQKFLIKRLQHYLNKDDAWLEEFLKKKFRKPKLWALSMRQASAAIRLLLEFAARRDIKLRFGQDYEVCKAEVRAEIPKIKKKLKH